LAVNLVASKCQARFPTHLPCIVGARVLEIALLLGVDPVARLVEILVGAIEVDLLLLPDDGNGLSLGLGSDLGPGLGQAEQQGCCSYD